MKLLVLTTRLFDEPRSGGEICTARLLDGLREAGHQVTLLGRGDAKAAAGWAHAVHALGPVEPPFDEQSSLRRLSAVGCALWSREPITVSRQGGRRMARALAPHLERCEAVVVDHLQAWSWLDGDARRPRMLVTHNVESDNYMRQSRAANRGCRGNASTKPATRFLTRREAHSLRKLELTVLREAAAVACLSRADAERLQALALAAGIEVSARVEVLSGFPRPMRALHPVPAPDRLPRIGLIGTWTWAPNRQGLRWLLDTVWPLLEGRAQLVLAGNGLDDMSLPAGTHRLGRVAEASHFYESVDVVAIPAITGSGVQEKAIEAIATGMPVVATPHALRGLGDTLPAQVLQAADADAFARACLAFGGQTRPTDAQATAGWIEARRTLHAQSLARCLQALGAADAVSSAQGASAWRCAAP